MPFAAARSRIRSTKSDFSTRRAWGRFQTWVTGRRGCASCRRRPSTWCRVDAPVSDVDADRVVVGLSVAGVTGALGYGPVAVGDDSVHGRVRCSRLIHDRRDFLAGDRQRRGPFLRPGPIPESSSTRLCSGVASARAASSRGRGLRSPSPSRSPSPANDGRRPQPRSTGNRAKLRIRSPFSRAGGKACLQCRGCPAFP
jgi:hypothetical protein